MFENLWRRKWQPTPLFLPGETHEMGCLAGCSLKGCKESDVTEQQNKTLRLYENFVRISGYNGNKSFMTSLKLCIRKCE